MAGFLCVYMAYFQVFPCFSVVKNGNVFIQSVGKPNLKLSRKA